MACKTCDVFRAEMAKLKKQYDELCEAHHRLANEACRAISDKDLELLTKCKACTRGIR